MLDFKCAGTESSNEMRSFIFCSINIDKRFGAGSFALELTFDEDWCGDDEVVDMSNGSAVEETDEVVGAADCSSEVDRDVAAGSLRDCFLAFVDCSDVSTKV